MTGFDRQVYVLNPREFSPETIAVAFAKTSRSPESFMEIARELTEDKSAEFNEKWVVGYGHSSVAEHAVLHIAIENVSRLAVEMIESSRLASFTEKSTRYQKWSSDAYFVPEEVKLAGLEPVFRDVCKGLFEAYKRSLPLCREVVARQCSRNSDENEAAYERRLKSVYVDSCRYLLPASALANVGVTANARVLEHLICKLLSHPLMEVRQIGDEIKNVAIQEVPTLVKYAHQKPYLVEVESGSHASVTRRSPSDTDWCELVNYSEDSERRFLAAILYRDGNDTYQNCLTQVDKMTQFERVELAGRYLSLMGRFDYPVRETEHSSYTFDLRMDQGAYYEVKRHRMMTQTPQALTCDLGYSVPRMIVDAGFESEYREAMEIAREGYEKIVRTNPNLASYLVPNAYYRRVLITLNFREAFSFTQLRSAPGAHYAVRRVAQRLAEQIKTVHPILGSFLRLNKEETWQGIEQEYFVQYTAKSSLHLRRF